MPLRPATAVELRAETISVPRPPLAADQAVLVWAGMVSVAETERPPVKASIRAQ
jgi:hypothetical protein